MRKNFGSSFGPLDYGVWPQVASVACKDPHINIQFLKDAVETTWKNLQPEFIKNCCRNFRRRLEAVVNANGDISHNIDFYSIRFLTSTRYGFCWIKGPFAACHLLFCLVLLRALVCGTRLGCWAQLALLSRSAACSLPAALNTNQEFKDVIHYRPTIRRWRQTCF